MGERSRVAVIAILALAAVACGARVVPLSQDLTGQPIPGVDPSTGIPVNPTQTGGPVPSVGPTGGGGGVVPGVGPGAKQCRATKPSDVGVTATTIKLGLVASLTGPFPGQFDSSVQATDSYFRMINDLGGICGRRVQLLIRDDNGNGQTNLTVASRLAEEDKVFAFVGSVSAPDDSGIPKVSKKHKIPDIGFPLTWERAENTKYTFGLPGQLQRNTIGEGASGIPYLNRTFGVKQVAIFWLRESEVSILNAWAFQATALKLAEREGRTLKICYERPAGVVDSNYDSYVVSMEEACDPADGPIAVYTTMENTANIKLAQAMRRQGFKPRVFAPTFTSYRPEFISEAAGATEGAYLAMPQIPFERLERPQSEWTPGTFELKRYMDALRRSYARPDPPGSFGGAGWGMGALFTQAAAACGDDLTRRCLLSTLESMGPFSANGFLSPNRPGSHAIYTADLIVQVRGGKFVELRPNDKSGPKEAPDFWDDSVLYNWWDYYCANKNSGKFLNTNDKDRYIRC